MFRRRGAWSIITNTSDRDTAISLLRSAGHGNIINRNVNLILSSKVKIDKNGNIVELILGKQNRSGDARFRQQQQQQLRPAEGNMNVVVDGDDDLFWELSDCVGKLKNLNKLVLCHCRSLPSTLNELPELKCLELHFCDGNTMFQRQQEAINFLGDENGGNSFRFKNLRMIEFRGGIWDAQSMFWMKCKTRPSSQLENVRFSFLQNELRHAIFDFLSPSETKETRINKSDINNKEGEERNSGTSKLPTSKLKHLTWVHSGMTDQGLELLIRSVVLPHHPNISTIDVSGNQIRSIQFLFGFCANGMYSSNSIDDRNSDENTCRTLQRHCGEIIYHPLRTLNLEHNPVLRHRISNHQEVEAFELLLHHCFPLLGSLTPSWESWDTRIEYLLRINRGGRVLVEGNGAPITLSTSLKQRSKFSSNRCRKDNGVLAKEIGFSEGLTKKKIHLAVWPLVLQRAYKTSAKGFLPRTNDATAVYYLVRNGPALSEIFATHSS